MIIRELSGVIELAEPMTLNEPTTLRGPAVLRGSCRDALIYARAEVILEDVHVERTPRPDGTPSWGSCVVVEGAGVATLRGCRVTGAAHGYLVEPGTSLQPGESWVHAGVDVRGTGHATVEGCEVEDCATPGLSASIYPADDASNLIVRGGAVRRCARGVAVMAQARAELTGLVVDAVTDAAVHVDGGRLITTDLVTRDCGGDAICAQDGSARVKGGTFDRVGGSAVVANKSAKVVITGARFGDAQRSGVITRDEASVTLTDVHLGACGVNGLEAVGASTLSFTTSILGAVRDAALLAQDAAVLRLDRCALPPSATWAVWADVAARVELRETPLPEGTADAFGAATVTGVTTAPWDLATWKQRLGERTWGARTRSLIAEAIHAADPAAAGQMALSQWAELGVWTPPITLNQVSTTPLSHKVTALAVCEDGCFVALADNTVARLGPDGAVVWRARGALRTFALVAAQDTVLAVGAASVRALAAGDGATLGDLPTSDATAALALGPPISLVLWDSSGHPTDRCARLQRWTPGEATPAPEVVGHAGELPDLPYAWVAASARWPGGVATRSGDTWISGGSYHKGAAITGLGDLLFVGSDQLRAYRDAALVAIEPLGPVTALAAGARVWAGTAAGLVVQLAVEGADAPAES